MFFVLIKKYLIFIVFTCLSIAGIPYAIKKESHAPANDPHSPTIQYPLASLNHIVEVQIKMTQARLSFSNDDGAQMLNLAASTPSRAVRQRPRKDYAQMHNGKPASGPAAPQNRSRGRSASPLPMNHRAPTRQRSPLLPSPPDTIEPSDSISQSSQRVPDILKKTWKKKPRTGIRRNFSNVYDYFETVNVEGVWYKPNDIQQKTPHPNKTRLCLLCAEEGKEWESSDKARYGATTNLWYHLKKFHQVYPSGQEPVSETWSQPTLTSQGFSSYNGILQPDMSLEQAIIEWIVDTQQPFDVVENKKWKDMWKVALRSSSRYRECPIKSQQVAKSRTQDEFNKNQYAVYKELGDAETVAFSLDVWKAPNRKYIFAIIVHWTTKDFMDRQIVLHFGHLKGSHTGENLARETLTVLKLFNLERKLVAITGDNASNNPTLCRHLHKLLSKDFTSDITHPPYDCREQMEFKGDQSFIRCLAHILNLIAKAILKALNAGSHKDAKKLIYEMAEKKIESFTNTPRSAIARLRLIVLWILASEQRTLKFREYSEVGLDYDVDTRWNALLKMLELAIRSKDAINHMCEEYSALEPLKLSPNEWNFLGEIYEVMLPFYEKTLLVSQDSPTITQATAIYWDLDDVMDEVIEKKGNYELINEQIRQAVLAGRKVLDEYTRKMDTETLILYAAAVLDPRVKTDFLKAHLREGAEGVIDNLRIHFKEVSPAEEPLPDYPSRAVTESRSAMNSTSFVGRSHGLKIASSRRRMLEKIQKDHYATAPTRHLDEIDEWLSSPPIQEQIPDNMTAEQDVQWLLAWWRTNQHRYPRMARIARRYLSIPASEVGVERLFSRGRDLLGLRRYALHPGTMKMLTILKASYSDEVFRKASAEFTNEAIEDDIEVVIQEPRR